MPGVVGKAGDGGAQAVIAGPAEDDAAAFAGLVGDGAAKYDTNPANNPQPPQRPRERS